MQIVIDISDEDYKSITQDYIEYANTTGGRVFKAIKNGIPLPKGHGRLIDVNELKKTIQENDVLYMTGFNIRLCDINSTPTIIEADKSESEG